MCTLNVFHIYFRQKRKDYIWGRYKALRIPSNRTLIHFSSILDDPKSSTISKGSFLVNFKNCSIRSGWLFWYIVLPIIYIQSTIGWQHLHFYLHGIFHMSKCLTIVTKSLSPNSFGVPFVNMSYLLHLHIIVTCIQFTQQLVQHFSPEFCKIYKQFHRVEKSQYNPSWSQQNLTSTSEAPWGQGSVEVVCECISMSSAWVKVHTVDDHL